MIRRIYLQHNFEKPYYKKGTESGYQIFAENFDNTVEDITSNVNTKVFSMDDNILLNTESRTMRFVKIGSGVVKFTFSNDQGTFSGQTEFISYETWFSDNYAEYLFTDFERDKLNQNKVYKCVMDTLMEYLDILYAYNEDLKVLKNFNQTRSKYLEILGNSMVFPKIDQLNENTVEEPIYETFYRELLNNLVELMSILGTKQAYDLFFNALGYDIKLEEFWFDSDGNLVEVSPYDYVVSEENPSGGLLSTFYRYTTEGIAMDEPPVQRPDPRQFADPNNDFDFNSKSKYTRPVIQVRQGYQDLVESPGSFTPQKRQIFRKYLELLRPQHIKYLEELLRSQLAEEFLPEVVESYNFSRLNVPGVEPENPDFFVPSLEDTIEVSGVKFPERFFLTPIISVADDLEFEILWDTEGMIWDQEEITGRKLNWDDTQFISEKITFNLIN